MPDVLRHQQNFQTPHNSISWAHISQRSGSASASASASFKQRWPLRLQIHAPSSPGMKPSTTPSPWCGSWRSSYGPLPMRTGKGCALLSGKSLYVAENGSSCLVFLCAYPGPKQVKLPRPSRNGGEDRGNGWEYAPGRRYSRPSWKALQFPHRGQDL
jgi:hypothetical protein